MLRRFVLALACVAIVLGVALCVLHVPGPGLQLLFLGVVALAALRFERWRYRSEGMPDGPTWRATGERFEDPETGRVLDVEFQPETGERRYVVAEDSSAGSASRARTDPS